MNSFHSIAPEAESHTEFEIPVGLELRNQKGKVVPASVRRVNAGFILLTSPIYLLKDTRSFIVFGRQRIQIEVAYCKPEGEDCYLIGARMNPESGGFKRREPRLSLDLTAKVSASHLTSPVNARVVDMSRHGMGLTVPFELPVGTKVTVELSYGIAHGEIRHCTQKSPGSWRVGLWMEQFVPWNEEIAPLQRVEQRQTSVRRFVDWIRKVFVRH